jgi:hypothetical protein
LFQVYCFAPKSFWKERAAILNASSPSLFHVFWVLILTAAGGLFSSSVSELVQRAGLSSSSSLDFGCPLAVGTHLHRCPLRPGLPPLWLSAERYCHVGKGAAVKFLPAYSKNPTPPVQFTAKA